MNTGMTSILRKKLSDGKSHDLYEFYQLFTIDKKHNVRGCLSTMKRCKEIYQPGYCLYRLK